MKNYLAGLLVVLGSLSPAASAGAEPPEVAAYNAASALVREGKLQQAVPQLERAIEIRPSYSAPYFALGEIYGKRGLPSQGMLYYMRFVSLEPDGERSATAAKRVFELLTFGVKPGDGGKITISMNPDADKADDLGPLDLGRTLAASTIHLDEGKAQTKAERYVSALKSFVNLADELTQGGAKLPGVLWKRAAAPIFTLDRQGVLEGFLNVLAVKAGFEGAEAWLKKNSAQKAKLDSALAELRR